MYTDDIIVYSAMIHEHITGLIDIFKRLRKVNLKIQPDKCEFLREAGYYERFILYFAKTTEHLTKQLQNDESFNFLLEFKQSVEELK